MSCSTIFYDGPIVTREEARTLGDRFFFTALPCKKDHIDRRTVSEGKCFKCLKDSWERVRRKRGAKPFKGNEARQAAIKTGQQHFFDGRPCKNGHVALRRTLNCVCVQCSIDTIKEYDAIHGVRCIKAWSKNNPEKIKAYKLKYRSSELGKKTETEYTRRYWKMNADIKKKYRQDNRERFNGYSKAWVKRNPEKYRAIHAKRRLAILNTVASFTGEDVKQLLIYQKRRCANPICRQKLVGAKYHVDHIIPLSAGGDNSKYNIQILCPFCNLSKGAKDPLVWARENGLLL